MSVSRGQSSRAASSACVRPAARRAAAIRRPTVRVNVSLLLLIELKESQLFASWLLAGQFCIRLLDEVDTAVILCCGQMLVFREIVAFFEHPPAGRNRPVEWDLIAVGQGLRPHVNELIDVAALGVGYWPNLGQLLLKLANTPLVLLPCLSRLLLAFLQRLLALGDTLDSIVKLLKVTQIFYVPALPCGKSGRLCDRVVDLADDVATEVAETLFHQIGCARAIHTADPRRHIFEEQAVLRLEAARSRQTHLLNTILEILIRAQAP